MVQTTQTLLSVCREYCRLCHAQPVPRHVSSRDRSTALQPQTTDHSALTHGPWFSYPQPMYNNIDSRASLPKRRKSANMSPHTGDTTQLPTTWASHNATDVSDQQKK
jgi:hypothetical protein